MPRQDIITRAFVAALSSYQHDHGQQPTFDAIDLMELDTEPALGDNQEAGLQQQQDNQTAAADTAVGDTTHQPPQYDTSAEKQLATGQAAVVSQQQHGAQPLPVEQLRKADVASFESVSNPNRSGRVRIRYTREEMLHIQPHQAASPSSTVAKSGRPSKAQRAAAAKPTQPDNNRVYYEHNPQQQQQHEIAQQQSQSQYSQQQQQQQRWDPYYYWGSYPYWDYSSWYTSAAPAAGTGVGVPSSSSSHQPGAAAQQQGGDQQQQQQWQQNPPQPPPAPPAPPAYAYWPDAAAQHSRACRVCGTDLQQGAAQAAAPTAVPNDAESIAAELMSQIPRDMAAVPESLAAAEAAIVKAAALSQSAEIRNNMAELMMAWFYAGYHAGKVSNGHGSSGSTIAAKKC